MQLFKMLFIKKLKLGKHLPHNVKVRKGKVANHINYNFVSTHKNKETDKTIKFGTLKAN